MAGSRNKSEFVRWLIGIAVAVAGVAVAVLAYVSPRPPADIPDNGTRPSAPTTNAPAPAVTSNSGAGAQRGAVHDGKATVSSTTSPPDGHDAEEIVRDPPIRPTPEQAVYLDELNPVKDPDLLVDPVSTEPVTVDGQEYTRVVRLNRHPFGPRGVEYNLKRQYRSFSARIGFSDTEPTEYKWHFEVWSISGGAPRKLADRVLGDGQVSDLRVPVDGVARFELRVRLAGPEPLSAGPTTSYPVVWANPLLRR